MKILLDECVVKRLASHLHNHQVSTVKSMGWLSLKNGKLLTAACEAGFEVILTTDKQMRHQQNMSQYPIALVILDSHYTTLPDLIPLLPLFERQIADFKPHQVYTISPEIG